MPGVTPEPAASLMEWLAGVGLAECAKILKKHGVAAEVSAMLLEPSKKIKFEAIPGLSGDLPSPRKKMQLEASKDGIYLYGGVNQDGDIFDEAYLLSLPDLSFRCLHKSELINKLTGLEKASTFCAGQLVSIGRSDGAKDFDTVLSIALDELTKPLGDDFTPMMVASLKERVAKAEEAVKNIDRKSVV